MDGQHPDVPADVPALPQPEVPQPWAFNDPPVGTMFSDRLQLSRTGFHPHPVRGIHKNKTTGRVSIVNSLLYEKDDDHGDKILYTGEGGRNKPTKMQHADQFLIKGNRALVEKITSGDPIRVIRGNNKKNEHAPATGYRYDGLYNVDSYQEARSAHGFRIYRFTMVRLPGQLEIPTRVIPPPKRRRNEQTDKKSKYVRYCDDE